MSFFVLFVTYLVAGLIVSASVLVIDKLWGGKEWRDLVRTLPVAATAGAFWPLIVVVATPLASWIVIHFVYREIQWRWRKP